MKPFSAILASLIAASAALALTISWDYPADEMDGITFYVYETTNVIGGNWAIKTNTTATNVSFAVAPGKRFYRATASNFWGESDPSNIINTPEVAKMPANLTIKK